MLKKKIKKSSKLLRQKLYLRKKNYLKSTINYYIPRIIKTCRTWKQKRKKKGKKIKIAKQNRNKKKSAEYEIFSDMSLSHATPYVLYATTAKRKV